MENNCQDREDCLTNSLNVVYTYSVTRRPLKDSINWAGQNAGKGKWAHLDATRIAAAGQSCGGAEAYRIATEQRVTTIGIFNSIGFWGYSSLYQTDVIFPWWSERYGIQRGRKPSLLLLLRKTYLPYNRATRIMPR
jgi:hypothetical protein